MNISTKRVGRVTSHFGAFDSEEVARLAAEAKRFNVDIFHREGDFDEELYFEAEIPEGGPA